jgi:hypothetical protein
MPAATPVHIRQLIVNRHAQGESLASIGRDLSMPYITVWKVSRDYQRRGYLEPNYGRCRQTSIRKSNTVYEKAIALKQDHRSWGAGLIWVELAEQFEDGDLPSVRTLQRWFKRAHRQGTTRQDAPPQFVQRGKTVHEVWAMDAKEQIRLLDGSYVSWLIISDEASGAILEGHLFPPAPLDPD